MSARTILNRVVLLTTILTALAAPVIAQDWAGRGRLQGKVKNEDNKPIAGAKIQLYFGGDDSQAPEPIYSKKNGRWSILGLRNGAWSVVIDAEGYVTSQGSVSVSELGVNDPVEVTLRRIEDTEEFQQQSEVLGAIEEANQHMKAGNFAAARERYLSALEEVDDQTKPSIHQGIAQAFLQEGQIEEAWTHLDLVLAAQPANTTALKMRAQILGQQGKTDEALAALDKVLEITPDDVDVLQRIISVLLADGREEDAQAYIARLPAGTAVDANSFLNLGIDQYNEGNMEEALRHFDRAATDNPDMPEVYYYRGLAYLASGELDKARGDFEHLIGLDADHPKAIEAKELLEAM